LAGWKNNFCQILKVLGVSDIWKTEIHTAEPLLDETSDCEVKMATEKAKNTQNCQVLMKAHHN
jgi:hypothetical protein